MGIAKGLTLAAAAGAIVLGGVSFSLAETGTLSGKVGVRTNNNITIEATETAAAKSKVVYHRLNFDVNTRVVMGEAEIKPVQLERGWMVQVEWNQQADPDLEKRKEALFKSKASQAKIDALKNRNPQLATKIAVTLATKTMIFKGTDNSGGLKLEFTQEADQGSKKKATKVFATGKFFQSPKITKEGGDEIRLSELKEGMTLQLEMIDRPGQERFPIITKIEVKNPQQQ